MRVKRYPINGIAYTVERKDLDGYCDIPDAGTGDYRIGISPRLRGRALLETSIHETLHAIRPDMTEESIDEAAKFQTAILWDMGFRLKGK
jgi:hypothetical protein